ncbi:MAG: flippase [Solobacterium sp.]|jgi:O-antigen/teichoic acid export membrane protein|nr:flippase [Solobacterium sp.]MCH4049504.1 flippase [Solobacterium sp.]MCH4075362.1 flippase [Solobacterium sp.]
MKQKSVGINAVLSIIKQSLAILLPMITVYYASRVLGKEYFGEVNYVRSIISYFVLISGLGIQTYAVREGAYYRDNPKKFNRFADQVFTINIISTIIAVFVLLFFILIPSSPFYNEKSLMLIFGLEILLQTFGAEWINSAYEDFLYITIRYIVCNIIALILLFALVRNESDYCIYAFILVLSTYGGNLLNIFYIRKYAKLKLTSLRKCKKHIKPIMYLFSTEIASTIYISSDTTMLGALVGNSPVAIYTVASNIYTAVKRLSNAAITVALPRLSFYASKNDIDSFKRLFTKIVNYVLVILLPSIVGVFMLSKQLMIFMGGEEYAQGYISLQILSIAILFGVCSYLLSRCVILPYKQDKTYMIATIISAIINIVLNIFLIPVFSYNGAAFTTLISEVIIFAILYKKAKDLVSISIDKKSTCISLNGCILIALCCVVVEKFNYKTLPTIIISIMVSIILYILNLYIFKHPVFIDILKKAKKRK